MTDAVAKDAGAGLSAAKRALLERWRRGQSLVDAPRIPRRVPAGGVAPLSLAQQRLWLLEQLAPGTAAHNMAFCVELTGALDAAALRGALDALVARHEVLRTAIALDAAGEPVQRIDPAVRGLAVAETDLSSGGGRDALAAHARARAAVPFDLARAPLVRAELVRLGPAAHALLLTMHHLVSDGWSFGVLVREVAAAYASLAAGAPVALAELPLQYADYAAWERAQLAGDALAPQLAFWQRRLAGAPHALALPFDRAPSASPAPPRGARHPVALDAATGARIHALAQRAGTTPFVVLTAAFQALLARYTGQRDFLVGTPVAHRTRAELEGLIGFFVNTLVLRADLAGAPDFAALVARVHAAHAEAQAHQDVPFDRLVAALQPERSADRAPLVQAALVLQNAPLPALALPGVRVAAEELATGTARFEWLLALTAVDGGYAGFLEYRADLFDTATAARAVANLGVLLDGLLAAPSRPVADVPLLAAAERRRILDEWNATAAPWPVGGRVHDLFEAQAARTPEAVAVELDGAALTYAQLDARANQLAHALRGMGVGPDARVATCLERSVALVVAVLATLKAGGAYVPVDPAYPRDRRAHMLADADGVVAVLTQRSLRGELPPTRARVVCLDDDADVARVAAQRTTAVASGAAPDSLAYVIYTSGSTGRPRAVGMTHRPLVNLLAWQRRQSEPSSRAARTVQFSSLSFDVAFQELFSCWATGGTLVLTREAVRQDPLALARLLDAERIERLFLPFVALQQLAEACAEHQLYPRALREVVTAGEALRTTPALVAWFARLDPAARLYNQYGPVECHVVTAHALAPPARDWAALPPIGRPIANARIYLLDARLEPVPVGVPGELYIGGAAPARGYLGDPAATAARFVPDPFAAAAGCASARMYRTGDRARYLADGAIEYLGRVDDQVKIRGYRVEPGEVEAALGEHPGVRAAAVVAREDAPGSRRLVGYFAPAADAPTPAALRAFLAERLPEYMLPTAFVAVERLPLTPSGKVDRRALPAPRREDAAVQARFVPPRTAVERVLASAWAEVLRIERVGARDNFFELGGDSMLALRVAARARAAGVAFAARDLLKHQTVADLAEHARLVDPAPRGGAAAVTGPVPLTPVQAVHLGRVRPEDVHRWNLGGLYRFDAAVPAGAVVRALDAVARREEAYGLRFELRDGRWTQHYAGPPPTPLATAVDLTGLPARDRLAALERAVARAQASLHVTRGPVVRFVVFDLGPDLGRRLLIVVHWLVTDAVSLRIVGEQAYAALAQQLRGEPISLAPRGTSFVEWARAQDHGAALADLGYWSEIARRPVPRLPVELPDGANTFGSSRVATAALSLEQTRAFVTACARRGVSPSAVLAAAYAWTVRRWCGQTAVLVAVSVHGREPAAAGAELSTAVGRIAGFFPAYLDVAGCADADAARDAVAAQLAAVPRGGAGYAALLESGAGDTPALARLAAPDTRLDYTGQVAEQLAATDVFARAPESSDGSFSPTRVRRLVFFVPAAIVGGRLGLEIHYSDTQFRAATADALVAAFRANLLQMAGLDEADAAHRPAPDEGPGPERTVT